MERFFKKMELKKQSNRRRHFPPGAIEVPARGTVRVLPDPPTSGDVAWSSSRRHRHHDGGIHDAGSDG